MAGDCYQANGNFIISQMNDKAFKLCHGVAILATDGRPFGHAWIEKGNLVMDFSNGKNKALPKLVKPVITPVESVTTDILKESKAIIPVNKIPVAI